MNERREELRRRLLAIGFDEVRFARLEPVHGQYLHEWLGQGMHADMHWMEKSREKRLDPALVLPGARSAVLLGVNYWDERVRLSADKPSWARYALYSDYHDTIKPALQTAGHVLEELCGLKPTDYRYYVDTGPVVERGWAARAGLGFVGKNGMLISRKHGNWLFLAAILTTAEWETDPAVCSKADGGRQVGLLCGTCTRCSDNCPTGAIVRPGVVDARLCISYQTIENRGIIPRELRTSVGQRLYGCDSCLDVCPWNRFARAGRRTLLAARDDIATIPLAELLAMTPERFAAVFKGTAIKRVKLPGLLRNACLVAANTGNLDYLEALVKLSTHPAPLVRLHAVWAVCSLTGAPGGQLLLRNATAVETEPDGLAESAPWGGAVIH